MLLKKNNILLTFLIIIIVYLSSFVWNYINVPFNDHTKIIGKYLTNRHHSLNDPLRYLFFILTPLFGFLSFKILIEKKKINFSYLDLKNLGTFKVNYKLYILCLLVVFFLLLEFLSVSFSTSAFDILHDGQKLSAAYKGSLDKSLWSGSYMTIGAIIENLGVRFIWAISGQVSIGAMRFLDLLYVLIFKISIIFLIYEIVKKNFFNKSAKIFYFLSVSLISISFIDYDLNINSDESFLYRDIPVIFFLIIFFNYLNNIHRTYLPLTLLGFLSVATFFWSIDRAIVVNFLLIFVCVYLFINKKYNNIFLIITSLFFFWLISYFYLGNEFNLFLENTFSIFKNINYVHGIIHPMPFSDMQNSSRATKTLLLIILSILISFSFLLSEKKKYNAHFKIIIITLSFVGFCSYLYALGRSDGVHIKYTIGFSFLLFSLLILYNLIKFYEKKLLNKKLKIKLFSFINLILLVIFLFTIKIDVNNILEYPQRIKQYISLADESFLSEEQNKFVKQINPMIKKYKCLQLFTYDAALPYLLRKPNCSRYYLVFVVGSLKDQNLMITEMKDAKILIYSGQTDKWGYSPQEKLPLVDRYIDIHFKKKLKISSWEVRFREELN